MEMEMEMVHRYKHTLGTLSGFIFVVIVLPSIVLRNRNGK